MAGEIGFELASLRVALWAVAWLAITLGIIATTPKRPHALRDSAVVLAVSVIAAFVVEVPQWVTYDTTVDFARAMACASGTCPGLGVHANYGVFEGGVVWIWLLAQYFAIEDAPRWLGAVFIILNALAAAILGMFAPNRRSAIVGGALYLLVVWVAAAAYLQWHPTLAPVALLPFVLLACLPFSGKRSELRYLALGAAFGLALGIYIASLLLFALLLPAVLRARWRDLSFLGAGLVVEQLVVQPFAALHNFKQIDLNVAIMGGTFGLLVLAFRRPVLAVTQARPWLFALVAFSATLAFGILLTGIDLQPYYLSLGAPLLAGAVYEASTRPRFLFAGALFSLMALGVSVWAFWFYVVAGDRFHEGRYYYNDLKDLAHVHRGGYGASVTGPSMLVHYSMPLWPSPAPAPEGIGIAYAQVDEADELVCDDVQWSRSGRLGSCEYESWVRSSGSTVCVEASAGRFCRTFESPAELELSVVQNPFSYWIPENAGVLHFEVTVCPDPTQGPRTLRPMVFAGIPVRRDVHISATPPGGVIAPDGTEVTITPEDRDCFPLEFEWDATSGKVTPWEDEPLEGVALERIIFMVEERRALPSSTVSAALPAD